MNITGTNKADFLVGTSEDDVFTGLKGRDTFVTRADGGTDVVTDFQWNDTDKRGGLEPDDRVLFDIGGSYSDILFLGAVEDGMTFTTFNGGATFTFDFADYNSDGEEDLIVTAVRNSDDAESTIVLLGIGQEDNPTGAMFAGG